MNYQSFKVVAYRYRYETAIENETSRISFGELLEKVNALYNSICQMGLAGKTLAVMTNNCIETVYAIIAASKAGCRCISLRASGPLCAIKQKLSVYRPGAALLHACHYPRLAPVLSQVGCSCAIVSAKAEVDHTLLPSVYTLSELLEINDYNTTYKNLPEGSVVLANDGVRWDVSEKISALPRRDGVYIGLPLYCGAGYDAMWQTLMSGHKCVLGDIPSKQYFKKKNVKLALLYEGAECFDTDAEFYSNPSTYCINNEFLYPEECEGVISDACGYPVRCDMEDQKVKVSVTLSQDVDITELKASPLAQAVADYAADCFYGLACRKSIIFKKTV